MKWVMLFNIHKALPLKEQIPPVDQYKIVTFALVAWIDDHEALICSALAECSVLFNDTLIVMACVLRENTSRRASLGLRGLQFWPWLSF